VKNSVCQPAEQELFQTVRDFHSCKQEEGQSVSSYVLKMKSYIDNLKRLGHPVSLNLGVSLILISLRKEFDSFMQNYNMHNMGKTVNELHVMLKLHEQTLTKKDRALLAIGAGNVQKKNNKQKKLQLAARGHNQGKGKNKLAYAPKPKIPPPSKSGSGIFTIELYTFPNKSWVYDTGCGTHICNTTQGLRGSKLRQWNGKWQKMANLVPILIYLVECMTRSSTSKLFTPYKEPKREFRSSRRHFKTLSLDNLRSPDFNLLFDQEYLEEEEAKAMAETMEQYMSNTQTYYGSGVARPKIDDKDQFELKGQFLKKL
ncbi:hypothetical protein Tco_1046093, partial [Tanacetum coccineum]